MQAAFQEIVLQLALSGLVIALVAMPVCASFRRLRTQCRTLNVWNCALAAVFLFIAVRVGGTKTNGVNNLPPQHLTLPRPTLRMLNTLPPAGGTVNLADPVQAGRAAAYAADWNVCGAWKDSFWLPFADGWVFPWGTNHLSGVEVVSYGRVWPTPFDTNAVASAGAPFEIVPGLTSFAYELTPSNSYRFSWLNAAIGRDTNDLVTAVLELFRSGDAAVTTNGVTRIIPRTLPFAHDGFGQDAEWVTANFTNATEIAAAGGYPQWVDQQVGEGLTNGLYKFSAIFPYDPPETIELFVGDYSVAVTNAGEYVFVLEKGEEYTFGTWPYGDDVEYDIQDDLVETAPLLRSRWGGWEAPGEWTVDGGWNWLYYPGLDYPGYCRWMPTLQGSPNIPYIGPLESPVQFTAQLADYRHPESVQFHWECATPGVQLSGMGLPSATVAILDDAPDCSLLQMSVRATVGGEALCSNLEALYGARECPGVAITLRGPKIAFLNDDDRISRYYPVSCTLCSPVDTNVTFRVLHQGGTLATFHPEASDDIDLPIQQPRSIALAAGETSDVLTFYFSCSETGGGSFTAEVWGVDNVTNSFCLDYRCIEPLQRLVTTEVGPDGRLVNPSRLVYGTNAFLKVGVNGEFSESGVRWSVAGPGMLSATNGFMVAVTPTADSGEVTVEARFGDDAQYHPRFVLPIVKPRQYGVEVYYVRNELGEMPHLAIRNLDAGLRFANEVFSQIGVSFIRQGSPVDLCAAQYAVLPERDWATNGTGEVTLGSTVSQKARDMFQLAPASANLRVFVVHEIVQGSSIAFTAPAYKATVFVASEGLSIVAHELGHQLGLQDIYAIKDDRQNKAILIPDYSRRVNKDIFMDATRDWGGDMGRSFYDGETCCSTIIESLLMTGSYGDEQLDIPSASVRGFSKSSNFSDDVLYVDVGAHAIERKESMR